MLKRISKLLLMCFLILCFTGCSAEVSLKFDKNNNIKQNIKIVESNSILEDYDKTYSEYIDEKIDYAMANNNKYKRKDFKNDTSFGTVYTKKSGDICKELKNSYFNGFFDDFKCKEYDDYYDISAKTYFVYCPSDAMVCYEADQVKFSIELPEKALDNDADYIEGNKYTWVYDRTKVGTLNIKIKRYKENIVKKVSNDKTLLTIAVIVGIVLLITLIIIILHRKYKKNRLEY